MRAHGKSSPSLIDQGAEGGVEIPNTSHGRDAMVCEDTPAERQRAALAALGHWTGLFGACVHRMWIAVVEHGDLPDLHEFAEPIKGCKVRRIPPEEITTDERLALGI